ncbi:MAG: ribosome silencing factor [Bacteriovoracaceae bacterium]
MSSNQSDFVSTEVKKIIEDASFEKPLNYAMASAWICGNLKGVNLKVLDVSHLSSLSDYFVFASATNSTQANAMIETIQRQLKKHGLKVLSKEGDAESDWTLLDMGDVIVHIFLDVSRQIYDLDSLWVKAKNIEIPNDYYFSEPESAGDTKNKDDIDYF